MTKPLLNHGIYLLSALLICTMFISSCQSDAETKPPPPKTNSSQNTKPKPAVNYPEFSGESAYDFVAKQVEFGPRVPGTSEHLACAEWLEKTFKQYADETIVQSDQVTVYNGKQVPMYNIIGSFNPDSKKRILLSAHWDTRPFADQDTERENEPIAGANDGGSGVAVLLELAKILKANPLKDLGVDLALWDVEDYGKGAAETYCLGSQYWSKTPHKPGYKAQFGINLDMVGAKGGIFYQEGYSRQFANHIVSKVWSAAHKAGYSGYFPFEKCREITDDHVFVNAIAKIPMIDIIQYDEYSQNGFFKHWHTHGDNMDIIDKRTLKAVGQTMVRVIYNEDVH